MKFHHFHGIIEYNILPGAKKLCLCHQQNNTRLKALGTSLVVKGHRNHPSFYSKMTFNMLKMLYYLNEIFSFSD